MTDLESQAQIISSKTLLERAKKEREELLLQIEQSQKTIKRSLQLIARIDELVARAEKE